MLKEHDGAEAETRRPRQSVQSVDRTLDLIEALAAAQGEISITHLAARTQLHVSTVHRLLSTLLRRGYVRQNRETARYYLGAKLALIAEGVPRYTDLRQVAHPILQQLTDAANETSNLVVLEDTAAVYIDQVQCKQVVRLFTSIGNRVPLHCTGAGKVLLAFQPQPQRDATIDRLDFHTYTPKTIVSRSGLIAALEAIRRSGYALDEEEYDANVRCVAVPVADSAGNVIAAISISAPSMRLDRSRSIELLPRLRRAAAEIAAQGSRATERSRPRELLDVHEPDRVEAGARGGTRQT
jgi:DNA-binding IclR family transcriptional regulator